MDRIRPMTAVIIALFGLVATIASLAVTTDLQHGGDGWAGDARTYGAPLRYVYTLTSDRRADSMEYEVYCNLVIDCDDGPGTIAGKGPVAPLPLAVDLVFWTVLSGVAILPVMQLHRIRANRRR